MSDERFGWNRSGIGSRVSLERGDESDVPAWLSQSSLQAPLRSEGLFVQHLVPVWKFRLGLIAIVFLCGVIISKAAWMQLIEGEAYAKLSDRNRLRQELLAPRRGIIRDRRGVVLAENAPSFDILLYPDVLPLATDERNELLGQITRTLGISLQSVETLLREAALGEELVIARDVDRLQALRFAVSLRHPAVAIRIGQKRQYPFASSIPSLAHVLGYVAPIDAETYAKQPGYRRTDVIGKVGLESTYESLLRGVPGWKESEVDALASRVVPIREQLATDGIDLTISMDVRLQERAEKALRKQLEISKAHRGSVIALDPRDGSVLALVSWPGFDNNLFSGSVSSTYYAKLLADPDRPLFPRAWAGTFPSGSTIKPVIAVAALAEHVVTAKTTVLSTGGVHIGGIVFPDWKVGGHGSVNVRSAIAWSVNTFFYYVGGGFESFVGLGPERLSGWMRKFGLGSKSGIDLTGEVSGSVPDPATRLKERGERWYIGDTYNLSIGQGDLLVTPLQVALTTARIANDGIWKRPHVGPAALSSKADVGGDGRGGETTAAPRDDRRQGEPVAPIEVVQIVQEAMRDTVVYGSGRRISSLPFSSSGKTGTAQWRKDAPNHAWYTGYAPSERPEIVLTILLEEGGEGSSAAVPVAEEILKAWWETR